MNIEQIEVLKQAIIIWGVPNQLDMATEELAELIVAINKAKRSGIVVPDDIRLNLSAIHQCRAINDLVGEIADVKIMVAQLELMLASVIQPNEIEDKISEKIHRLSNRMV